MRIADEASGEEAAAAVSLSVFWNSTEDKRPDLFPVKLPLRLPELFPD
jgi:hypothetical protein